MIEELSNVRAARLASILKKWQDAASPSFFKSIPKDDLLDAGIPRDELERNGLIMSEKSAMKAIPTQCGKREMARILTEMFGNGVEVFPETLTRAVEKDGMHGWNKKQSKFSTAQAIAWWRDNKAKTDTQVAEGAAAEAKRKIVNLRRDEIALAHDERQLDATWIKKPDAQLTVTAAVLQYHALAKKALDRDFAKLVIEQLGELDEQTKNKIQSAVTDAARQVVAAIEKHAETI